MKTSSTLVRAVAIAALLAALLGLGFVARLAARVEAPSTAANLIPAVPLVALPLVHALLP